MTSAVREKSDARVTITYSEKSTVNCELNNRTEEARPENFQPDPARFYRVRLVDSGMH